MLFSARTKQTQTVCPGSSDPIYIVFYYIKQVATSWTDGIISKQEKTVIGAKQLYQRRRDPDNQIGKEKEFS